MSLYPPEAFSKFVDLGPMTVHPSSFDLGEGVPVEEFFNYVKDKFDVEDDSQ